MKINIQGGNKIIICVMIKSIEFRYNRYESTLSLILLVGLFWLVGFALCLGLANVLELQNGTEAINPSELSLFWQRHAGLALAFTVILYTSVMIFSVYPAIELWRFLMDTKGKVEIYDDHAIIYFKSKEVFIDPSTDISHEFIFGTGSGSRSVAIKYTIQNGEKEYHIIESFRELRRRESVKQQQKAQERGATSLIEAMNEVITAVW